jgi:hypothetical protein
MVNYERRRGCRFSRRRRRRYSLFFIVGLAHIYIIIFRIKSELISLNKQKSNKRPDKTSRQQREREREKEK